MSTGTIILHVPAPPSLNKLWRHIPGKGRVKSHEYADWLRATGWQLKIQSMGWPPIDCRYDMRIEVPASSRRDIGNWEKGIGDMLEAVGVVTNDGNCNQLIVDRADRADCAVFLTPRPDLGDIRPPAKKRGAGRPTHTPKKPSAARLRKVAAVRARIPF